MKLPAHKAGLPRNEMSFLIVPLDPAYKAGLTGHLPVKVQMSKRAKRRLRLRLRSRRKAIGQMTNDKLLITNKGIEHEHESRTRLS